jgi:hypothetical protein
MISDRFLSEVWQQMIVSPDLIPEQAEELFEDWKNKLLADRVREKNYASSRSVKKHLQQSIGEP